MATTLEVSYFNTFWLKRLKNFTKYQEREPDGALKLGNFGGTTTGTPDLTTGTGYIESNVYEDWYVEESRIKGGFNDTSVDFGNKAYIVEEEEKQTRRQSSIIYSGVYNAKNGINNTNQFPIGEEISRSVDKDVIFTQEGLPLSTDARTVVGTPSAFEGNFGISRDPGSFTVYGYNKYFTDRDRGVVMQLGPNGLNPISNYGMIDYFRDKLAKVGTTITAGYDVYNKNYALTIDDGLAAPTVVFDDIINGWVSRIEYTPELSTSSRGIYYTFKNQGIWQQNADPNNYNNFYGSQRYSSVSFVFNPDPIRTKTFNTINYTGSNGWQAQLLTSDYTGVDTNPQQPGLGDTTYSDIGQTILSYDDGYYTNNGIEYRAGFDRKQNVYYAAIKGNGSGTLGGQVLNSGETTGLKSQFLTLTMQQDVNTDVNGAKQLFSVGTVYSNR